MKIDVLRQVRDWLDDVATGVNAVRSATPRESGEDPPPAVTIVDERTTAWVARATVPAEVITVNGPHLMVRINGDITYGAHAAEGNPPVVTVALTALVREDASHTGAQAAQQIVRNAVHACVAPFNVVASPTKVTRNGVAIYRPTSVSLLDLSEEQIPAPLLAAAALIAYPVGDPWSLGITL